MPTNFYVRPPGKVYGTGDGTSYANAYSGPAEIDWDLVDPGSIIYFAGKFLNTGGSFIPLTVGASGNATENIVLKSFSGEQATFSRYYTAFDNRNYLTFKNIIFIDSGQFRAEGAHHIYVTGCTFNRLDPSNEKFIQLNSGNDDWRIRGCFILNAPNAIYSVFDSGGAANRITVEGCVIVNIGTAAYPDQDGHGIGIQEGTGHRILNNITEYTGEAITFWGRKTESMTDIIISGNNIKHVRAAEYMQTLGTGITISGSYDVNQNLPPIGFRSGIKIHDNVIDQTAGNGIRVTARDPVAVDNNTVTNYGTGGIYTEKIKITNPFALLPQVSVTPSTPGTNWYLRPLTGGPYGANNGTSYANAWCRDGDVKWNLMAAGDRLYVIGDRKRGYADKQLIPTRGDIVIDGGYSAEEPGRIFSAAYFFNAGWFGPDAFGAYQRTYSPSPTRQYFQDVASIAPVRLINQTKVPDSSWQAGSVYVAAGVMWYKPSGNPDANSHEFSVGDGNSSVDINGVSGITVRNLTVACSARGVLIRNGAANTTIQSVTSYWQMNMGIQIGVATVPGCNGGSITSCLVHDCANGIYFVSGGTQERSNNNWTVSGNTVYSIDQDYFYRSTDALGLGLQGGSFNIFRNNAVYDCGGSGITVWTNGPGHICKNNLIEYNYVHDILDTSGQNRNQRGIEFSPDNNYVADETTGNIVQFNTITNAKNIGIRTKGKKPTTGHVFTFQNNTVTGSIANFVFTLYSADAEMEANFLNNVSANPVTFHEDDQIILGGRTNVNIDRNAYSPDGMLFKWHGVIYNLAGWKLNSGQDHNPFV